MREVYISVDVETDGPIPGPHSMLSLGAAAFSEESELLGTFSANLETLEAASPHPDTAAWWQKNRDAYTATRTELWEVKDAMHSFVKWAEDFPGKPVFVAYPVGFDFTFVYWYMMKFVGRSPFSFSALDIKSYARAKLGKRYRDSTKRNMPREWFSDNKHTHVAVDDAIEQGKLFMAMRSWAA